MLKSLNQKADEIFGSVVRQRIETLEKATNLWYRLVLKIEE